MKDVKFELRAEPIVPPWTHEGHVGMNGSELERAILNGFAEGKPVTEDHPFEQTFTFKEHGEFFRGALSLAGLRHPRDFYELLKRYEKIKVTISVKAEPEGAEKETPR